MVKCGVVYAYSIADHGLPNDDAVKAGKVFLAVDGCIIPARPVSNYPGKKKNDPVVWQTNAGDYLFAVTHYIECSIAMADVDVIKTVVAEGT